MCEQSELEEQPEQVLEAHFEAVTVVQSEFDVQLKQVFADESQMVLSVISAQSALAEHPIQVLMVLEATVKSHFEAVARVH